MVNPFDETQQAGQLRGPAAGIASLPGRPSNPNRESYDPTNPNRESYDPNREYRSFQTRSGNEPDAMAFERGIFMDQLRKGKHPWSIDVDLRQDWREHKSNARFPRMTNVFGHYPIEKYSNIDPVENLPRMNDYLKMYYADKWQRMNKIRETNPYFNPYFYRGGLMSLV